MSAIIGTAQRSEFAVAARPHDAAAVHAEHGPFVWTTLQRLGVRDADLDDVYQEVFVVVHQRLHTYDPHAGPMPAWLFGVCVRVAGAHRRRAHVRRECVMEDPPEPPPPAPGSAEGGSPEEAAQARQSREQLRAILDEMDLERRAVFVMYEIDELPCEQIAAIVGVPVGTVHSRLHAARKEFQRAVARWQARQARYGGGR